MCRCVFVNDNVEFSTAFVKYVDVCSGNDRMALVMLLH